MWYDATQQIAKTFEYSKFITSVEGPGSQLKFKSIMCDNLWSNDNHYDTHANLWLDCICVSNYGVSIKTKVQMGHTKAGGFDSNPGKNLYRDTLDAIITLMNRSLSSAWQW